MNIRVSFSLALTACLVRQIIATEWEGVGLLISLLACLDEGNCLEEMGGFHVVGIGTWHCVTGRIYLSFL